MLTPAEAETLRTLPAETLIQFRYKAEIETYGNPGPIRAVFKEYQPEHPTISGMSERIVVTPARAPWQWMVEFLKCLAPGTLEIVDPTAQDWRPGCTLPEDWYAR